MTRHRERCKSKGTIFAAAAAPLPVALLLAGMILGCGGGTSETETQAAGSEDTLLARAVPEPGESSAGDRTDSEALSTEIPRDHTAGEEPAAVSDVTPARLAPPAEREPAPDFSLPDLSGREVSLDDFAGKIVILDFWATWCPPCRMEIPHFIGLHKDYNDRGVEIVGIALDRNGIQAVQPFVQQHRIPYVSLIGDQQIARRFGGVRNIPTTFIIDQKGRIVSRHVGYQERSVFEREIVALLQES
ncbi:MAG: redoxin domain-containing protein [Candidatus Eisenbacteria bacterium]|nr:redoxin domain-containing protein [Candidatus Eisenbacteria bacterium]